MMDRSKHKSAFPGGPAATIVMRSPMGSFQRVWRLAVLVCTLLVVAAHQAGLFAPVQMAEAAGIDHPVEILGINQPPGFDPDFLQVHLNDTVTFVNHDDSAKITYTLADDGGTVTSPPIPFGGQWTWHPTALGAVTLRDPHYRDLIVMTLFVADDSVPFTSASPGAVASVIAGIRTAQTPTARSPSANALPFGGDLIRLALLIAGGLIALVGIGGLLFVVLRARKGKRSS